MERKSRVLERRPLWVIGLSTNDCTNVFCVGSRYGGRTLPIFSFREEVEIFLDFLDGIEDGWGWQPKQTTPGELVSLLMGPCRDVARVALDPLPVSEDGGVTLNLGSMSREHFVRMLLLSEGEDGQASVVGHASGLAEVVGIAEYSR
jgi:hypothetical protein